MHTQSIILLVVLHLALSCSGAIVCTPGHEVKVLQNGTSCVPCAVNMYSTGTTCAACPTHSSTNGLTEQGACVCDGGYQPLIDTSTNIPVSPLTCTDVNECLSPSACDVNAACTNSQGSYACTCNAGYSGDGLLCQNINECSQSVCDPKANCTDTQGSFICVCLPGYYDLSLKDSTIAQGKVCKEYGLYIEPIGDVTGKVGRPVVVPFVIGNWDPSYVFSSSLAVAVVAPDSVSVIKTVALSNGFLRLTPALVGSFRINITVSDYNTRPGLLSFLLTATVLSPFFDNVPPGNTFQDLKTTSGTPTFPYTFRVGHEDETHLGDLMISAKSGNLTVVPDNCCENTSAFREIGGIFLNLTTERVQMIYNGNTVYARNVIVVINPHGIATSTTGVDLRFFLTDKIQNIIIAASIKLYVYPRPSITTFCTYDVKETDTLISIANSFGMHWMTLFMLNNNTISHPDRVLPGSRISIGRAYIVKAEDSIYSIATRFGTTWQQVMATNPDTVPNEQAIYAGQLLCIAPDLAFISCTG
uniref:LysM domain-containing protein n=1 Tax=Hanusia phi TaxID=3032 RepID=A0A7S0EN53_9CRYP|mmetsp:Transcript_28188/g.63778  ORF Transcript_28188/g.63778 Transcript_28188/m.63778 type:complete len:529 (+) Transcript_28188:75-1661(+)